MINSSFMSHSHEEIREGEAILGQQMREKMRRNLGTDKDKGKKKEDVGVRG